MEFLGLHYAIWIVVVAYFIGMLALGWWSKREAKGREGFLLGKRQFGVPMMVMHAFGAGTHPNDVAGVMSKTVMAGPSGIWVSWMWMFGTPFYWLIAPIVRRMRCLTMADYFEERFSRSASVLYVVLATVGMTIAAASVMLATTRTVQGMMGKAGSDAWFLGILVATSVVFVVYCYWGGIVAAIRTDFVQGLMIIALSFLAIPAALMLPQVGGWSGTLHTLGERGGSYLSLFDPKGFSLATVLLLCINAPFSMMAQPHLMTVCGAGKTEWEGRVGFTYGNVLKRLCTMGWCVLAMCWLAYLMRTGQWQQPSNAMADSAFGDSVRKLLPTLLQGVMLACVLAAGMTMGSAVQVTVAGLLSQCIYRHYIRPKASDEHYVSVMKLLGVAVIAAATVVAIAMRRSVVEATLDYFNLTAAAGIAVGMGIVWRRMNTAGVFASAIVAAAAFLASRVLITWDATALAHSPLLQWLKEAGFLSIVGGKPGCWDPALLSHSPLLQWLNGLGLLGSAGGQLVCTRLTTIGLPLFAGILAGIVGSLLTKAPDAAVTDKFFRKIYVPIGQEEKLALPLNQAVPPERRLCTAGGLFLVKPSRQSWVGFVVTLGICLGLVGLMVLLLR